MLLKHESIVLYSLLFLTSLIYLPFTATHEARTFLSLPFSDLTAFLVRGVQEGDVSIDMAKGYVRLSHFTYVFVGPAGVPKPISIRYAVSRQS